MYDITQHPFFKRGIAVLVLAQSVLLSVKVKADKTLGQVVAFVQCIEAEHVSTCHSAVGR